jgi:hypothetical protein
LSLAVYGGATADQLSPDLVNVVEETLYVPDEFQTPSDKDLTLQLGCRPDCHLKKRALSATLALPAPSAIFDDTETTADRICAMSPSRSDSGRVAVAR